MNSPIYLLVDNGSLEAGSTLNLRNAARLIERAAKVPIYPVSLLHSSKVEPEKLAGVPALTMDVFLRGAIGQSSNELRVVPFFFGPSRALTEWLPGKLEEWKSDKNGRSYRILGSLYDAGDNRLALALEELSLQVMQREGLSFPFLSLVDHGTPVLDVHRVREEVGAELKIRMNGRISGFATCSMERREGEEYDFNEPLLENLLAGIKGKFEEVLVAQLFLSPGRHAGEGGDLDAICSSFTDGSSIRRIFRTELLGDHPLVMKIILERIREDLEG